MKELVNPTTRQVIYKAVFEIKTPTSVIYIGLESLYKPEGYPSFELLSYIMDSDLSTVKNFLQEQSIDSY
jgi:hypothetical protein